MDETAYLLSDNDIQIMLRLINMRAHGHDATHSSRIRLARPRAGRMHNAILRRPQEIRTSTQPVQHPTPHHARAIRMRINIDLDRRVHPNDAQPSNNLGRIAHLLRAQNQLRRIGFPALVEPLKAVWGKADARRRREIQMPAVEQVQEAVLQHLGPHFEVAELGAAAAQPAYHGVGDVPDAGLDGEERLWEASVGDLVLEEFDEVSGDGFGGLVFGMVGLRLVWVVGFDDGDDALRVDGDVRCANAVLGRHDQVGFSSRWEIGHGNVVEAFHRRGCSVDFNDYLPEILRLGVSKTQNEV